MKKEIKEKTEDWEKEIKNIENLIKTYEEYIDLFKKEEKALLGLAVVHGWQGNKEDYKKGEELRKKIKLLKEKIKV